MSEVQEAEQAITDAEADLAALERRVVEGDATITATDLAERRGAIEFARLQLAAAQRRERLAVEQDREAQADAFRAQVDAFLEEYDARLTATFVEAVRAVNVALEVVREQRATLARLHRERERVGGLFPPVFDGRTTVTPTVRGVSTDGDRGLYVRDGATRRGVTSAGPHEVAMVIAAAALTTDEASGHDVGSGANSVVRTMPPLVELLDAAADRPRWKADVLLSSPDKAGLLTALRRLALAEDPDGPDDERQ